MPGLVYFNIFQDLSIVGMVANVYCRSRIVLRKKALSQFATRCSPSGEGAPQVLQAKQVPVDKKQPSISSAVHTELTVGC